MTFIEVLVEKCDYPDQPRTFVVAETIARLAENMKKYGQKVPVIGYFHGERFQLEDGGCRLQAARQAGLRTLLGLDVGKKPSRAELLMAQASIDQHRQSLPPVDKAKLFRSIMEESRWTARHLSEALQVSEGSLSRTLALLSLPEELQQQVNAGILEPSKAYLIGQESDPAKQAELASLARGVSRDSLSDAIRKRQVAEGTAEKRMSRVTCPLPSGVTVVVSGEALSLDGVIAALADAQKEARKARDQGLDAKTFQAVLKDKAKAMAHEVVAVAPHGGP
jgi:ParB family chromosome partitioning protein